MEIQEDFEELLRKSAQAIRSANYRIREVLTTRGSLRCSRGFLLSSDCKELILNLKKLSDLIGDKDVGFSQSPPSKQAISEEEQRGNNRGVIKQEGKAGKLEFEEYMNKELDKMVSKGIKSKTCRDENGKPILLKIRKAYSVHCDICHLGQYYFISDEETDYMAGRTTCPRCRNKTLEIMASRTYKV